MIKFLGGPLPRVQRFSCIDCIFACLIGVNRNGLGYVFSALLKVKPAHARHTHYWSRSQPLVLRWYYYEAELALDIPCSLN